MSDALPRPAGGGPTLRQAERKAKACGECGARFGEDGVFCPFDGHRLRAITVPRSRDPAIPPRIAGRYDVVEPLGEGGMGTVFRVRHVTLERDFALKLLRHDLARDADLAERFVQEARATARIHHPAIVSISDFGLLDDGVPWFVMELLAGRTLAALLRDEGPLPVARVVRLARRIADGLVASHEAGIIHRDLKPENVFVLDDDEVRIVDFGAAKVIGASPLTRPGIVFGTPYYMAPEQACGLPLDGRADVYALGVLLYELVTGRVPFEADTYMGVLTKHLQEAPPRPVAPDGASLGPLGGLILRALAKEPADRHASMSELRGGLDAVATSERLPVAVPAMHRPAPLVLGEPTAADRIARSVARHEHAEASRRRRLWGGAIVGACGTTALGVGVLALLVPASPPPPPLLEAPPPVSATLGTREPASPSPSPSPSPSSLLTDRGPPEPSTRAADPPRPVVTTRARPVVSATPPVVAASASVPASATASNAPRPRPLGEAFPDPWK